MLYQEVVYIPFHLSDSAGVVYFGNVFQLTHQAYENYVVNQLEFNYDDWFRNNEWIVPIVHAEADYLKPLLSGRNYTITLQVTRVGETSFTLNYEIIDDLVVYCKASTTHIFCNKKLMIKRSIPTDVRQSLQCKLKDNK